MALPHPAAYANCHYGRIDETPDAADPMTLDGYTHIISETPSHTMCGLKDELDKGLLTIVPECDLPFCPECMDILHVIALLNNYHRSNPDTVTVGVPTEGITSGQHRVEALVKGTSTPTPMGGDVPYIPPGPTTPPMGGDVPYIPPGQPPKKYKIGQWTKEMADLFNDLADD
jgi:hypothetical protein